MLAMPDEDPPGAWEEADARSRRTPAPSKTLRRSLHLVLTTDAIIKAAEFWAFLRQTGLPTSSADSLDADAIFAGQTALAGQPGDIVTIATTNLAHLNRFPGIDAQTWDRIQ